MRHVIYMSPHTCTMYGDTCGRYNLGLSANSRQRKAQIEAGWLVDDADMMADAAADDDKLRQAEEQLDVMMQQLGS